MNSRATISRRQFIGASAALLLAPRVNAADPDAATAAPIIDIHQHTHYHGRTDEELIAHQKTMGVTLTVLLPAGSPVNRSSTRDGRANGLEAQCGGNQTGVDLAKARAKEFLFFANEVPD